ncbi:pentatricopeptide repeat-containing protein At1g01970 [Euphorbia lathyris]|uniref:pentatricopeptide repeat-containing protein At1g01970 n=1 Tax=Euphorbia lathyris TaxID=212925 RepID=UPI003313D0C2
MANCGSSILTFPFQISQLSIETTKPNFIQFLGTSLFQKPVNFATHVQQVVASVDDGGSKLEKEKPRFKWLDVGTNITEAQKKTISELPPKMTKRCKALLRQIICHSYQTQGASLSDLLGAWARIMKPRRTDWLSILKHLKMIEHPLYLQVAEHALLEESFEANVRDYTKVIHCYGKQNQLQIAENVLLAMKERGFVIDQVTLTTMIHIYSKAGKLEQAEETFEELKLLGHPLDGRAYGSMIMAYIRAGMPREGEVLLAEMNDREIYAGTEVYKALLRAYCMAGDADGAQRVFDSIQFAGIPPDARMCGLLINAYLMAGQSQKALIAYRNMRKAGLEPSDKCNALALGAYEKDNNLDGALNFLIGLEREGIMVGKEASEVLAGWFRRLGVVKEVELVLREYVGKEVSC